MKLLILFLVTSTLLLSGCSWSYDDSIRPCDNITSNSCEKEFCVYTHSVGFTTIDMNHIIYLECKLSQKKNDITQQQQKAECPVEKEYTECFNVEVTDNLTRVCASGKDLSIHLTHNISVIMDYREPYGYGFFRGNQTFWDDINIPNQINYSGLMTNCCYPKNCWNYNALCNHNCEYPVYCYGGK